MLLGTFSITVAVLFNFMPDQLSMLIMAVPSEPKWENLSFRRDPNHNETWSLQGLLGCSLAGTLAGLGTPKKENII